MVSKRKTITITEETYELLSRFGDKSATWDDVLRKLCEQSEYNPGFEIAILNETKLSKVNIKPVVGFNQHPAKFLVSYEYDPKRYFVFTIEGKCSEYIAHTILKVIGNSPEIQYSQQYNHFDTGGYVQKRIKGELLHFKYDAVQRLLSMKIQVSPKNYKL